LHLTPTAFHTQARSASDNDPVTPTTVTFFDTLGAPIASESLTQGHAGQIGAGANNRVFYGLTSDVPIGSITAVNAAGDGDGIIYDDVQWVAVPEPATLRLAAALGGFASCRPRRRRSIFRLIQ
jgi:hypothetical protein